MPLNLGQLANDLEKVVTDHPKNPAIAAQKLAKAYEAYASQATGAGLPVSLTGSEVTRLQAAILPAIASPLLGLPPIFGAAWQVGITAFWIAPPVLFGPGLVTVPPAPTIVLGVTASVLAPKPAKLWALAMATALHSGVAGVMQVTIPGAPPIVGPVL